MLCLCLQCFPPNTCTTHAFHSFDVHSRRPRPCSTLAKTERGAMAGLAVSAQGLHGQSTGFPHLASWTFLELCCRLGPFLPKPLSRLRPAPRPGALPPRKRKTEKEHRTGEFECSDLEWEPGAENAAGKWTVEGSGARTDSPAQTDRGLGPPRVPGAAGPLPPCSPRGCRMGAGGCQYCSWGDGGCPGPTTHQGHPVTRHPGGFAAETLIGKGDKQRALMSYLVVTLTGWHYLQRFC